MKNLMVAMLSVVAVALLVVVQAKDEFKGDKVFRINPKNDAQVKLLKTWIDGDFNLDVWQEPSQPGNSVDVHVTSEGCTNVQAMLKANGIPYKTMIEDVDNALKEEEVSNKKFAFAYGYDYTKYNSWSEIKRELYNMVRRHSSQAKLFSVGKTYEGENQIGIQISNGGSNNKRAVWIDGGIHAREWISPATVMYFANKLLTSNNANIRNALSKYNFYILPVFNIDGYKYTHTGGRARFWRKTRKPSGWGCYGTDPNRNWDSHFGGAGTSSNPCQDTYHGKHAFSEIEVKNVADYLRRIPNLISYWNVHAYSQLVLTPWSYTTTLPKDYAEIKRVADVFVTEVRKRYGVSYRAGPPSRILYAVAGGSIDWTYEKLGVKYSYALELRDKGRYGFLLPANQITPSGEETTDAIIAAILAIK